MRFLNNILSVSFLGLLFASCSSENANEDIITHTQKNEVVQFNGNGDFIATETQYRTQDSNRSHHIVTDGMTLTLRSNNLQQVEFRAQSFGPGFCRTDVTLSGSDTIVFAAPVLVWSDWKKASNAYSGGSYKVTIEQGCDTGSSVEARYLGGN